ncbi:hypothetical protein [Nocardioides daphniae]|nr:hypothetical protein [Nocardioides daphniae]QCC76241.1 hypothetical protein E2C04_01705 [Nocardioides daphniae]
MSTLSGTVPLPPRRRRRVAPAVAGAALALLLPLAPASADEPLDRSSRPGWKGSTPAVVQPRDLDRAARVETPRAGALPKVKSWSRPKALVSAPNGFQSYDIARNGKGAGIVAWTEIGRKGVRPWFRRVTARGKWSKPVRLAGWSKQVGDGGISGQVAVSLDRSGRAVVGWTAAKKVGKKWRTGVQVATVSPRGKVARRWITATAPPPPHLRVHTSPNGHTVVWWNGHDPKAWGHPVHFVSWKGRAGWTRLKYARDSRWMPDEGGDASVSTSGLVTATWVERGGSLGGRLRAVTLDSKGTVTQRVAATASNMIMNSTHTATDGGNVTVSYMDSWYDTSGSLKDTWYTVRRTNGVWAAPTVTPKKSPGGNTWDIDGNNSGKVAMIGLGYSAENPPEWVTVTAGIQAKPGGAWDVRGVQPRVRNEWSYFNPGVHMTANGKVLVSYRAGLNGVAWQKNGAWVRAGINRFGDFKFASDSRSRVSLLAVSKHKGWSLTLYTKKF